MNTEEIIHVIENKALPDTCNDVDYLETPNSWIILSDNHAFKIRKQVQENGKELPTFEQRKNICLKELKLNKPLAGKTYESVVALKSTGKEVAGANHANFKEEHALKMKRLEKEKSLFEILKKSNISSEEIREIATTIAEFHKNSNIVKNTFRITEFQEEYEEIKRCRDFVLVLFGETYLNIINKSIQVSKNMLNKNRYFIQQRTIEGYVRDGHGNLNANKIFLNRKPIITDRVILDDEKRKVDVLFDIALVGINLDFHEHSNLDELFLKHYIEVFGDQYSNNTQLLYTYYKLYRTGQLITKMLDRNTIYSLSEAQKKDISKYFNLLKRYMESLQKQK